MGLLQMAGKMVRKKLDKVDQYKDQYRGRPTHELKRMYENADGTRRMAIYALLKERGEVGSSRPPMTMDE